MQEISALNKARFFGRTTTDKKQGICWFNWSGSGFGFCFEGTSASAYFYSGTQNDQIPDNNSLAYISVFVDELSSPVARFPLNEKENIYNLCEGLPYGKHTVYVIKETEVGNGRAAVSKLYCDGVFSSPLEEKDIKIEFIGDSITCGYGNLCSREWAEFETREEAFSQTYASVAARLIDAEISCVAASGNGFYHDYGCNTRNLIPEFYLYRDKMLDEHLGISPERWDFKNDRINAVVIKLGQNDAQYCLGSDLPEEEKTEEILKERRVGFTNKANEFLTTLRQLRPETPIVLIVENNMHLKNELFKASEGIPNLYRMEIESKKPAEGVGANGHWSLYTHARVGLQLAEKLKEILCLQ